MTQLPPLSDLSRLSHAEKDALIIALWTRVNEGLARVEELMTRVAALEAQLSFMTFLARFTVASDTPMILAASAMDIDFGSFEPK